ncbi:TPR domain protein [Paramagnetospirillum magnetotacticum MS-1]|uniref:TPR domain protein n=1 Tax=Paramagnetospirillum magnetotacticum MS-1 TaxID=272627 RepID=A0A0C2YCE8_PARME|nr:tetratricopeptide repeat protein [Paramagnetospirillum magnetotacticum]KIL97429.1 TPR domain protein [Paramagnetospirillum magnetotacticum MS-1]
MAAAIGAGLAACAPRPDMSANDSVGSGNGTGLGAYLAGRFAHARGDTQAAAEYYSIAARRDPDNIDIQQRSFALLLAEGRLDEAGLIAQRLLVIDDDSPLPTLVMGVQEARAGRFDLAEKRFSALPAKGINGFLGPLLTAWSRAAQGQFDEGLATLSPRADTAGFAPIWEYHAGLMGDLAGRPDVAEAHFKAALANQTSVRTVEAAGTWYQRAGRMDEAKALYERYHAEHGDRSLLDGRRQLAAGAALPRVVTSATEGLAEALFDTSSLVRQGNAQELSLVFSRLALSLRPDFPLAQLLLADAMMAQGRLEDANTLYRSMNRASQPGAFARLKLAVNLDELKQTDAAIAELKSLAAEWPDSPEAMMTLGDILRRHKRYSEAADAYGTALARNNGAKEPRNWALYYARGIAYERAKQWSKAEPDMLEALRLSPDQPDVLNYLGYTWVDQGINVEKGRKLIERAVELRPNDGAIVDSLGWALYRMGEFQAAVKYLERASELKPEDATVNEHLGDAFWRVGRETEARYQWKRAMGLDPEPEQIEPLKAKISTGRLPGIPLK